MSDPVLTLDECVTFLQGYCETNPEPWAVSSYAYLKLLKDLTDELKRRW